MSECNDNASTWTHVLPDRRRKFPSGKYAADRKWLLLEAKRRSFVRLFKRPFTLIPLSMHGQCRPGPGEFGVWKTIFYKPMSLFVFFLRVFQTLFSIPRACVRAVVQSALTAAVLLSLVLYTWTVLCAFESLRWFTWLKLERYRED